jgi:hypothetical protein
LLAKRRAWIALLAAHAPTLTQTLQRCVTWVGTPRAIKQAARRAQLGIPAQQQRQRRALRAHLVHTRQLARHCVCAARQDTSVRIPQSTLCHVTRATTASAVQTVAPAVRRVRSAVVPLLYRNSAGKGRTALPSQHSAVHATQGIGVVQAQCPAPPRRTSVQKVVGAAHQMHIPTVMPARMARRQAARLRMMHARPVPRGHIVCRVQLPPTCSLARKVTTAHKTLQRPPTMRALLARTTRTLGR